MESVLETKSDEKIGGRNWPQYLTVIIATLTLVSCGMHFGWTSPSLPKLSNASSPFQITNDEGSWMAALFMAAGIVSAPFGAQLTDAIGRKFTIILTAPIFLLSWILIAIAQSATELYIARVLGGIAFGVVFIVVPIYACEVAEARIRGSLGSFISIMYYTGILFSYGTGPYVSIPTFAMLAAGVPCLLMVAIAWIPESPYYLVLKGRESEARNVLARLRCSTHAVDAEWQMLRGSVQKQRESRASICELFTSPTNRKALLIMLALRTSQQMCGMTAFTFYAQDIFSEAGCILAPSISALLSAILQLASCLGSGSLLDRLGRKPMLLISCVGSAAMLAVQVLCFYTKDLQILADTELKWVTNTAIFAYVVLSTIGLGVVPYVMMGELFPTNVTSTANCIIMMYFDLSSAIISKMFQRLADAEGIHVNFIIFMFCCLLSIIFVTYCIPETKGKSFEEIQTMLRTKKLPKPTEVYCIKITNYPPHTIL